MTQGILPFKYEEESNHSGATALAGLPIYLDLAKVAGLHRSIEKHLTIKAGSQGWTDTQQIMSLILLNLAGGETVEDLNILNSDEGFCRILNTVERYQVSRKVRRELERRWRKDKKRMLPSPSSAFRYLCEFHDPGQEQARHESSVAAFIPKRNPPLRGLMNINKDLCASMPLVGNSGTATLDMDACLVETGKKEALYCYKGFQAYQPLNTWWAETEMILHTEFRDGNVPAGYEQLRVFKEALRCLPQEIKTVRLRSDTAGYQHDLLRYCECAENERFGRIEFAIGSVVSDSFKQAVEDVPHDHWHPIYKERHGRLMKTGVEWAEVCYVPKEIAHSKNGPSYRYIAKRQQLEKPLPGMEDLQQSLPFPTMEMDERSFKVFGIVTNISESVMGGEQLIHWLHERCGKSEQAHSIMKEDLAGGTLPSGKFGANAAWWWIMILALNLNQMMKKVALPSGMKSKRMKAIRYWFIRIPGRVMNRSRQLLIRLSKGHPAMKVFIKARQMIASLQSLASG